MLFAAFISFCGVTHALEIVNIWHGYYYLQGMAQLVTGVVSALTGFILWRLVPNILAFPSREALNEQNEKLRLAHEELEPVNLNLEQKVKERTESLQ